MSRVLIVDDDRAILETAAIALRKTGFTVDTAADVNEARSILSEKRIDLILSDIYMPGDDGLSLLSEIRAGKRQIPVILMTARGTVETATVAARVGAFDYLAKPFDISHLIERVRAAVTPSQRDEYEPSEPVPPSLMIGAHTSMVEVYKAIARVSNLDIPVLVTGETGTGKELVARAIHELGSRADHPFVPVNCGAIPETLLESELFGYVRGAFTDARRDRRGALDQADEGTIFLDEIGDISLSSQVKLLRFLQDRVVVPLGSERGHAVNVRVVAATNRDLPAAIRDGSFREDLYFRIAGYEVHLPPLRDRSSDIHLLVEHFADRIAREIGLTSPPRIGTAVMEAFVSAPWPGNVRELEHVVRRLLIDSGGLEDPVLTAQLLDRSAARPEQDQADPATSTTSAPVLSSLEETERAHILEVLKATGGNKTKAARILGIERKTLGRKLASYESGSRRSDGERS